MDYEKVNKIVISVIGDRKVGKTCLLNALIFPEIVHNIKYIKTIGCDIRFLCDNENNILIKFFDFGFFDLQTNVDQLKEFSKISSFILYIINSNIEKINYINKFSGIFKHNNIILVLNKNNLNNQLTLESNKVKEIIEKNKINKSFEVSGFNKISVDKLKEDLISYIKENIENKEIKSEEFFKINPELIYKTRSLNNGNKIGCF
jgi:tRNA U34 5-carboxymethylaminomethyl modifying GTPase MnmE/TrmE